MKSFLLKQKHFLILACCISFIFSTVSCIKEEEKILPEDKTYTTVAADILRLPVNLSAYNLLTPNPGLWPQTKSEYDTTSALPVDSLINWNKALQISSEDGIVYTQIPFLLNESPTYAAIASSRELLQDSIARIKCFYIIFEDCFRNYRQEYIVTMIPTPDQLNKRPDYDFLNKPNFSGAIIYADSTGTYVENKIYQNGLILEAELLAKDSCSTEKFYLSFYQKEQNVLTKSNDNYAWEDELSCIVVTALKGQLFRKPKR